MQNKELVVGKCNPSCNDLQVMRLLTEKMTDGAIIFSSSISDETIQKLATDDFPIVVLDRELYGKNISCVLIDNKGSAYKVGQYIHNLGLKKAGCLVGPGYDGKQRMAGFQKAVEEFELDVRPEWIIEGNWVEEEAYQKTIELVRNGTLPQVLFAFNDEMAKGCMEALKRLRFKIPEDISIIGMDDIWISAYLEPKLTTVHRPLYELGVSAAETLLHMMNGGENKKIVLPTTLIQRESCIKDWIV